MFSDESWFYLKRVVGENESGDEERHVPATEIPIVAFHGGGVMVWTGISATAKTDLVFIEGNLNAQRYINEVLKATRAAVSAPDASRQYNIPG